MNPTPRDQARRIRARYRPLFAELPQKMRFARWGHLEGLADLCARLPAGARGLEIGSFAGESTVIFLECGVAHLTCLDAWTLLGWKDGKRARVEAAERVFDGIAARFPDRLRKLRATSAGGLAGLAAAGEQFDFAYIDADHSRAGVLADIAGARTLVRPGGFLCGHDYGRSLHPGVTEAVDEALGKPDEVFRDFSWLKRLA